MTCPATELAARCRANTHDASLTDLESRPDVTAVNAAWSKAVGIALRRLGCYSDRNRPLQAILDALAVASLEDVLRACDQASRDDWCCGRKGTDRDQARKRDVGCLSPTVLRRLLDAADAEAAKQKRKRENEERIAAAEAAERRREREARTAPRVAPTSRDINALVSGVAKPIDSVRTEQQPKQSKPMTAEEIDRALGATA